MTYPRCSAITLTGKQCTRTPVYGRPNTDPLCWQHLPPDEQAARAERSAAWGAWWSQVLALPPEPACWSWVITDEIREHVRLATESESLLDRATHHTLADQLFSQGRCALCGIAGGRDVEDHDHRTGLVRGYLCRSCNTREGAHRSTVHDVFARYRERYPCLMLGLVARYSGYGWEDGRPVGETEWPAAPPTGGRDNAMRGVL